MKYILALLVLCSLALAEPSYLTFPADIDWQTQNSSHFQIIFRKGQEAFAERTLRAAERAHRLLSPNFPPGPELTRIVLADFQDSLNGYSLNFPYPHMVVFATPPEPAGQLSYLDSWLDSVVLHEYVHTLHLYPVGGLWKPMRSVFGTWVVPIGMLPSHFHEGMATLWETLTSEGGRGKSPHFKMYARKATEAGEWGLGFAPLDLMDGTPSRWVQGTNAYFFGVTLHQELYRLKKETGLKALTESQSSNWPYFTNTPLEEVYGMDYPSLWAGLYERSREENKKELAQLKTSGLSPLKYLTGGRFHKRDVAFSPDGAAFAFRRGGPRTGSEIAIQTFKATSPFNTFSIPSGTAEGLCWGKHKAEDWLIYLVTEETDLYAINRIEAIRLSDEKKVTLELDGAADHLKSLACKPDLTEFIAFRFVDGKSSVVRLQWNPEKPDEKLKLVQRLTLSPTQWVSGLSYSPDKWVLVRERMQTQVYAWKDKWELAMTLPSPSFAIRQSTQGKLYAISAIDGIDEVWELDPNKKTATKTIAVSGGINSFAERNGQWLVTSYEHGGYDVALASAVTGKTISTSSSTASPLPEEPATLSAISEYSPWSTLVPRTWVPSMLFVPDGLQVGAWIPMFDLSQKHFYDIYGGYDSRGLPFGSIQYGYRFARAFTLSADVGFNPGYLNVSKTFYKRWGGSVGLSRPIPALRMTAKLSSIFRRIESSRLGSANQSVGFDLDLTYKSPFKVKPLSVSPVNGIKAFVSHSQFFRKMGSDDDYYATVLGIDGYLESPLWSDAAWYLGLRQGYTEGTALYNSYFEAGGELLFSQGRGTFLNRGYPLGFFAARRLFTANGEFRFPITRVERGHQLLPAFLERVYGALTLDTSSFDFGLSHPYPKDWLKTFYWSTGVEVRSDWKFFYYLPTLLRLGVYRGLSEGGSDLQIVFGAEASL